MTELTRGRPDSSRAPGQSGMVCLTQLSDEEFENQLQLFQGRLSSIFEAPAEKDAPIDISCRTAVDIS